MCEGLRIWGVGFGVLRGCNKAEEKEEEEEEEEEEEVNDLGVCVGLKDWGVGFRVGG